MKLTPEKLEKICDSYGIRGRNKEDLVKEFFAEYPNIELYQYSLPFNSGTSFSLKSGKSIILTFRHGGIAQPCDGIDVPATAELFGKDFCHRFVESYADRISWWKTNNYRRRYGLYVEEGKNGNRVFSKSQDENKTITEFYDSHGYPKKTIIRNNKDGSFVCYNKKGKLTALFIRNRKEIIRKKGFLAKVVAHKRSIPIGNYGEPYSYSS